MRHVRLRVIALALALVTGVTGTLYLLRPPAEAVAGEDLVTSAAPATDPAPTTTSEPATTTSTVDPAAVIEYATRLWEATSTTTTAAPPSTLPPATVPPTTARPTTTRPAPTTTAPPPLPAPEPVVYDSGGLPPFLLCVRHRESGDNYATETGNGYHGAFQFLQSTWDNTARHAGRPDLVGIPAGRTSPADQDAMAIHLLSWQGPTPWAGYGC